MAKNELDLDMDLNKELGDSLDFLDDSDLNDSSATNNNYFGANKASINKTKIIYIAITAIVLSIAGLIFINKRFKGKTVVATVAPAPTIIATQPEIKPETPEILETKEELTWQDLQKTNTAKQESQEMQETTQETTEVAVGSFEHKTPAVAEQFNTVNNKTQESIDELKTSIAVLTNDFNNQIKELRTELQNNMLEASKAINKNVDTKILNLTSTVDTLSSNIKKYTQEEDIELTASFKPSEPDLFSNTPEYLVHAIIPGRAWLKSATGQIITITEGDNLGDYGKVALIDTANNLVRTSSGVVFR